MDNLPDLPFEKIIGYLDLEELIKADAKRWLETIESLQVKSLFYCAAKKDMNTTRPPSDLAAYEYHIWSSHFCAFISKFRGSVLKELKMLCVDFFHFQEKEAQRSLFKTLNSLVQLERLAITRNGEISALELSLPNLHYLRCDRVSVWSVKSDFLLNLPQLREVRSKIYGVHFWRSFSRIIFAITSAAFDEGLLASTGPFIV